MPENGSVPDAAPPSAKITPLSLVARSSQTIPRPKGQRPSSLEKRQSAVKRTYTARCPEPIVIETGSAGTFGLPVPAPSTATAPATVLIDVAPGVVELIVPVHVTRRSDEPSWPVARTLSSFGRLLPMGSTELAPPPMRYTKS